GVLVLTEVAEVDLGRLARGVAEDHHDAAMVDPLDRRLQRDAAGGFEYQAETPLGVLDASDDLDQADPVQHRGALAVADDGSDAGAGADRKLHREIADA